MRVDGNGLKVSGLCLRMRLTAGRDFWSLYNGSGAVLELLDASRKWACRLSTN